MDDKYLEKDGEKFLLDNEKHEEDYDTLIYEDVTLDLSKVVEVISNYEEN